MPVNARLAQEESDRRNLERYRTTKDVKTLDELARRFEPLIRSAVNKLCAKHEIYDADLKKDILGAARVGLVQALKSYKLKSKGRLSSWCYLKAYGYAQNEMFPALESNDSFVSFSDAFETEDEMESLTSFAGDSGDGDEDSHSAAAHPNPHFLPSHPKFEFLPIKRWSDDPFADAEDFGRDRAGARTLRYGEDWLEGVYEEALQRLPADLRQTARWHLIDGWTQARIAFRLGISQQAVCKRLNKAEDILAGRKVYKSRIDRSGESSDVSIPTKRQITTERHRQIANGKWRDREMQRRIEAEERRTVGPFHRYQTQKNYNIRAGETTTDYPAVVVFAHTDY